MIPPIWPNYSDLSEVTQINFEIDDLACNASFSTSRSSSSSSTAISLQRVGVEEQKRRAGCWKVFVRKRNFWSTEKFCTAKETFRRSQSFFSIKMNHNLANGLHFYYVKNLNIWAVLASFKGIFHRVWLSCRAVWWSTRVWGGRGRRKSRWKRHLAQSSMNTHETMAIIPAATVCMWQTEQSAGTWNCPQSPTMFAVLSCATWTVRRTMPFTELGSVFAWPPSLSRQRNQWQRTTSGSV